MSIQLNNRCVGVSCLSCVDLYFCVIQELLEQAEWGADLPTVENNLQEHNNIHTAVKELMSSVQEARTYEVNTHTHTLSQLSSVIKYSCPFLQAKVSPNYKISYSDTLAKLEHQYCKLLVSHLNVLPYYTV